MTPAFDLSRKDLAIIEALCVSTSHRQAAEIAGVDRTTVSRRMQNPEFCKALAVARRQAFRQTLRGLQGLASRAAKRLEELMSSPDVEISYKSAMTLLNHVYDADVALHAHEAAEPTEAPLAPLAAPDEGEPTPLPPTGRTRPAKPKRGGKRVKGQKASRESDS